MHSMRIQWGTRWKWWDLVAVSHWLRESPAEKWQQLEEEEEQRKLPSSPCFRHACYGLCEPSVLLPPASSGTASPRRPWGTWASEAETTTSRPKLRPLWVRTAGWIHFACSKPLESEEERRGEGRTEGSRSESLIWEADPAGSSLCNPACSSHLWRSHPRTPALPASPLRWWRATWEDRRGTWALHPPCPLLRVASGPDHYQRWSGGGAALPRNELLRSPRCRFLEVWAQWGSKKLASSSRRDPGAPSQGCCSSPLRPCYFLASSTKRNSRTLQQEPRICSPRSGSSQRPNSPKVSSLPQQHISIGNCLRIASLYG